MVFGYAPSFTITDSCCCLAGCARYTLMSLTLEEEQKLQRIGLIEFFDASRGDWDQVARRAYDYLRAQYPQDSQIRPDDVAKIMISVVDVDQRLIDFLATKKLREKYWYRYFVDLIIERCWDSLATERTD